MCVATSTEHEPKTTCTMPHNDDYEDEIWTVEIEGKADCKASLVGRSDMQSLLRHYTSGGDQRRRRTVPLSVFMATVAILCILAISMGVGLGLGLPRTISNIMSTSTSAQDYSTRYGVPKGLPFVPIQDLINTAELDLDTDFRRTQLVDGSTSNDEDNGNTKVREYTFNITQALAAPDGFTKPMILVNGQSPGPLIEANTSDTIRVHVNNQMANTSTTIHWHGIDQVNSTWMDGVVGVSQCGIPAGRSFTYEFTIGGQRGTFWWHAHKGVQYTDGVYGPLVSIPQKCGQAKGDEREEVTADS